MFYENAPAVAWRRGIAPHRPQLQNPNLPALFTYPPVRNQGASPGEENHNQSCYQQNRKYENSNPIAATIRSAISTAVQTYLLPLTILSAFAWNAQRERPRSGYIAKGALLLQQVERSWVGVGLDRVKVL